MGLARVGRPMLPRTVQQALRIVIAVASDSLPFRGGSNGTLP